MEDMQPRMPTALGFIASPLPPAIFLQPARLNRNNKHWPDSKTTRAAVTRSRAYWADCLALAKLTVADFRLHIGDFCLSPRKGIFQRR